MDWGRAHAPFRSRAFAWAALVVCAAVLSVSAAPGGPASFPTQGSQEIPTDRLIVRLKGGAPALTKSAVEREALAARMQARSGELMLAHRVMGDGSQVMRLFRRLSSGEIRALAQRYGEDPEVIEILPDRIYLPALTPNDPLYPNQWYLSAANGINAPAAWDLTTGSSSLIIAIVDTGKLPHNELASRWIGGYDFVGDVNRANDGDGSDADATDPGDWVTTTE